MVGTTLNKETYAITSASTGAMDIPFRYDDNSWIYAVAFSGDGETTTNLTLGSDFTLGGDGSQSLGEITLSDSFLETIAGATLVVYRIAPALQTLDLQYNTRLPAEALEAALDTLAMASIDRSNILQRTFTFPFSDPDYFASSYVIESANDRKGTVMAFSTVDGKPVRLTYAEIAPLILEYYGLEITSEDVLAAISAIAPIEIFDVPGINTPGKFGQLAIIPELVDLVISGTLSPAIGGTVLPWKRENNKVWFSTSGEDPALDGLSESVLVAWTGSSWTILHYLDGVAQSTAWISIPGVWNDDPYPDNVGTWVPLGGSTGQPNITIDNERPARIWVNLAPNGAVPNWKELEADVPRNIHFYIGDSIMGPMYGFWGDDLIRLNASYIGAAQVDLATPGAALFDIQSTLRASLEPYGKQPKSVFPQVFIGTAINDAGQPALSVAQILAATTNCATIAKDVLGDHAVVTVVNMPSRSSQDARALEYNQLLQDSMPSPVIDFVFDLYTLAPDIQEGVHQSELGNEQMAEEMNNLHLGNPTEVPNTILLPIKTSQAITSIGTGNPSLIPWTAHGMQTGDFVELASTDSTPVVDGIHQITRVNANSFTIPVNVTVAGTTGTINKGIARIDTRIPYNIQNTWRVYSHNDNAGGANTEAFDATNGWSAGGKYEFILKSLGWFANGFGESSPIFEGVATNYDGGTATLSVYFKNKSTSFSYKLYSTRTGGGLLP